MNYRGPVLLVDEDIWCVALKGFEILLKIDGSCADYILGILGGF